MPGARGGALLPCGWGGPARSSSREPHGRRGRRLSGAMSIRAEAPSGRFARHLEEVGLAVASGSARLALEALEDLAMFREQHRPAIGRRILETGGEEGEELHAAPEPREEGHE